MFRIVKRESMAEDTVILNEIGAGVASNARPGTRKGVWAGGDIVTGQAKVILAMGAGRMAADSIHDYLTIGW